MYSVWVDHTQTPNHTHSLLAAAPTYRTRGRIHHKSNGLGGLPKNSPGKPTGVRLGCDSHAAHLTLYQEFTGVLTGDSEKKGEEQQLGAGVEVQ